MKIHDALVLEGKANDKFVHYCKTDGLSGYLNTCRRFEDITSNINESPQSLY